MILMSNSFKSSFASDLFKENYKSQINRYYILENDTEIEYVNVNT